MLWRCHYSVGAPPTLVLFWSATDQCPFLLSGRAFGIFFILLGSTVYTYVKDRETRAREAIASHGRPAPILVSASGSSRSFASHGVTITPPVSPPTKLGIDAALANSVRSDRSQDSGIGDLEVGLSGLQTPSKSICSAGGVDLHRLSPSATGATPRTPSRRLSYDGRQLDSGHGSSPRTPGNHGLAPGLYATPPPRLSFLAQSQQQTPSKSGRRAERHQKSFSVTDLKDILIAPSHTTPRGFPLYLPHAKEVKAI